jgi:hypothetical protein
VYINTLFAGAPGKRAPTSRCRRPPPRLGALPRAGGDHPALHPALLQGGGRLGGAPGEENRGAGPATTEVHGFQYDLQVADERCGECGCFLAKPCFKLLKLWTGDWLVDVEQT